MLNKIRLNNHDKEFKTYFDGEEVTVPSGVFDTTFFLGQFLLATAKKWKINLTKIEGDGNNKIEKISSKPEIVEPVVTTPETASPVVEKKSKK